MRPDGVVGVRACWLRAVAVQGLTLPDWGSGDTMVASRPAVSRWELAEPSSGKRGSPPVPTHTSSATAPARLPRVRVLDGLPTHLGDRCPSAVPVPSCELQLPSTAQMIDHSSVRLHSDNVARHAATFCNGQPF